MAEKKYSEMTHAEQDAWMEKRKKQQREGSSAPAKKATTAKKRESEGNYVQKTVDKATGFDRLKKALTQ